MRFLTMWYVRPAKPQISLRIRAVWSESFLVAWVFNTDWTPFGVSKLKKGCRGSSESTLVKMSNCWKSHAYAHLQIYVKIPLTAAACTCNAYAVNVRRFYHAAAVWIIAQQWRDVRGLILIGVDKEHAISLVYFPQIMSYVYMHSVMHGIREINNTFDFLERWKSKNILVPVNALLMCMASGVWAEDKWDMVCVSRGRVYGAGVWGRRISWRLSLNDLGCVQKPKMTYRGVILHLVKYKTN